MASSGLIAIAAALTIAISTIAPAIAQGMTASKAMDAIARQPEAAGNIRSTLIVSLGMIEALTLCDNTPGPVARILTAAIQAYQNEDDIRRAIDDAVLVELPRLESLINLLGTIAKVAPLLGLLGTVLGMQETFSAMRNSTSLNDLSGGISSALITTAAGLVLAIPCLIAYNYMVARVETFCIEMEKAASEIIYFFDHKEDRKKNESAD